MTEAIPTPEDAELVPGTDEYNAAMVAKFEASQQVGETTPAQVTPERPAWLPEKFTNPEDLAAAYAELEKKQSAPTEPAAEGETKAAEAVVAEAGLDFDALSVKFMQDGELAAADYEALAKVGISKDVVSAYVAGQQALASQFETEVFNTIGGADAYTETVQWASENLSADEIAAFDRTVDGGDLNSVKLAVAGLRSRYEAANGSTPKLLSGGTSVDTGAVFRSTAELTTAMKDPRYRTDPAYRADVSARLARSNIM